MIRPKMVERHRARQLAEPGARAAAARVEAIPSPERPLERVDGEVFGEIAVGWHRKRTSRKIKLEISRYQRLPRQSG